MIDAGTGLTPVPVWSFRSTRPLDLPEWAGLRTAPFWRFALSGTPEGGMLAAEPRARRRISTRWVAAVAHHVRAGRRRTPCRGCSTGSPSLRRMHPRTAFPAEVGEASPRAGSAAVLGSAPVPAWSVRDSGEVPRREPPATFGGFLTISLPTTRLRAHALRATLGEPVGGRAVTTGGTTMLGPARFISTAVTIAAVALLFNTAPEVPVSGPSRPVSNAGHAGAGAAGHRSARPARTPAAAAPAASSRGRGAPGSGLTLEPRGRGTGVYPSTAASPRG